MRNGDVINIYCRDCARRDMKVQIGNVVGEFRAEFLETLILVLYRGTFRSDDVETEINWMELNVFTFAQVLSCRDSQTLYKTH